MYDFNSILKEGETILYQGRPEPGKGDKSIGGEIFVVVFMLIMEGLIIWAATDDGIDLNVIIVFSVALFFQGICIYSILYKCFLKKYKVADDHYCITNKRVIKYEEKENKLVYGYVMNYAQVEVVNVKKGYGDVQMNVVLANEEEDLEGVSVGEFKNIMLNSNPENMPLMIFESVQNPRQVARIVKEARDALNRQ